MSQLLEIVRHYALGIKNGRTAADAFRHLKSEVVELEDELATGGAGVDGIKGEVMDIINCALDVLFLSHPEVSFDEIDALMEAKCAKWVQKHAPKNLELVAVKFLNGYEEYGSVDFEDGADLVRELATGGVSLSTIADMARTEVNSIKRILDGSMSFRAIQMRLCEVMPLLREAGKPLAAMLDGTSPASFELRELLSEGVVDRQRARDLIARIAVDTVEVQKEAFVAVPQGWKLVPVEANADIEDAGAQIQGGYDPLDMRVLYRNMVEAAPTLGATGVVVPAGLVERTFALQHNPNCPSPWLVRLPGTRGVIDLKPYGDATGRTKCETGDILGFGATLAIAAEKALAAQTAIISELRTRS